MPIYGLSDELWFPPVEMAEEGILAIGSDLRPERLLLAYRSGIFPWYSSEEPIIWWSPDPRFVLFPDDLKVSSSMKQLFKANRFRVTYNQDFDAVIKACSSINRAGQPGTWITEDMINAYNKLHQKGFAHSVEIWDNNKLVGGLYGIIIGNIYFGESMFHTSSNASKYGFIALVEKLISEGIVLIDCQIHTKHLESLGAKHISRAKYLSILKENI